MRSVDGFVYRHNNKTVGIVAGSVLILFVYIMELSSI